jgi:peptide/nickel transport system permease protein
MRVTIEGSMTGAGQAAIFHEPSRVSRIWHYVARFSRRQPMGAFSAVIVALLVFSAVFADAIAPYGPNTNNVGPTLSGPSVQHPFGTDNFGRDLFSRVIHGARISLYVGLGATLIAAAMATVLGAVSGYFGGPFDYILQRFVDTAQSIPALILLIGVLVVLGPSINNVMAAIAFRFALALSRVTRGDVIAARSTPYVDAARSIGGTDMRILFRHIMPNIFPTVIVLISTSVGVVIVAEAALSFLGYGVPPPNPTWGGMMSSSGRTYMLIAPWMLIAPTIALSLVVFAMNMLGDALRDELDPRMRGSR